MKFSMIYETQMVDTSRESEARCFHEMLEQVKRLEALDFDGVWAVEHTLLTQRAPDPAPARPGVPWANRPFGG